MDISMRRKLKVSVLRKKDATLKDVPFGSLVEIAESFLDRNNRDWRGSRFLEVNLQHVVYLVNQHCLRHKDTDFDLDLFLEIMDSIIAFNNSVVDLNMGVERVLYYDNLSINNYHSLVSCLDGAPIVLLTIATMHGLMHRDAKFPKYFDNKYFWYKNFIIYVLKRNFNIDNNYRVTSDNADNVIYSMLQTLEDNDYRDGLFLLAGEILKVICLLLLERLFDKDFRIVKRCIAVKAELRPSLLSIEGFAEDSGLSSQYMVMRRKFSVWELEEYQRDSFIDSLVRIDNMHRHMLGMGPAFGRLEYTNDVIDHSLEGSDRSAVRAVRSGAVVQTVPFILNESDTEQRNNVADVIRNLANSLRGNTIPDNQPDPYL